MEQATDTAIEPLLTLPEFREVVKVSRASMYRLIADGELGTVKIRGRTFIEKNELRRFIEAHRSPEKDDDPAESTGPSVTTSAGGGGGDAER